MTSDVHGGGESSPPITFAQKVEFFENLTIQEKKKPGNLTEPSRKHAIATIGESGKAKVESQKELEGGLTKPGTKTGDFIERRKEVDALFDVKFVCEKIVMKLGNDPRKALDILNQLCGSDSKDVRFIGGTDGVGKFSFPEKKVRAQLEKMRSDPSRKTQKKTEEAGKKTLSPKAQKKAEKKAEKEKAWVAAQLVGLVEREDVTEEFKEGEKTCEVKQEACHAETDKSTGEITLSDKKTSVSAELPKKERDVRTLPNTAVVTSGSDVIGFRSAKTHKAHLLDQRSKADIAARVKASRDQLDTLKKGESANGLTYIGDEKERRVYSYQPLIFTMMDAAKLKAAATTAAGLAKRVKGLTSRVPIEDERKFLTKMKAANVDRFASDAEGVKSDEEGPYREHVLKDPNGNQVVVRERPAIIQNHLFSGQSKSKGNRADARKDNIPGQMIMLRMMADQHKELIDLDRIGDPPGKKDLEAISRALKEAFEKATPEQKLILQAFHANLFGKGITGHSYDAPDSGADLAILTGMQADYFGLSFSPQCKSGNDRTIAAMALKIASKAFKKTTGRDFNPEKPDQADISLFNNFFTGALIKFGFSNVEASRGPVREDGKSGLKIKKSAAAHKYMNPEEVKKHGDII